MSNELIKIMPELMLLALALIGQLIAVFSKKSNYIASLSIVGALCILIFIFKDSSQHSLQNFHHSVLGYLDSNVNNFFKALIFIFTFSSIVYYQDYINITGYELKMEFITLALLSTLGIWVALSAGNLMLLFCGLEMQALSGYALAAFNSSQSKSSEAGLKYFILGALVSCITLFGMSFIYGFSGSLDYEVIKQILNDNNHQNIGLIIGIVLLLTSIIFKLSAAPMHIWVPDVYEGAPIFVVNFFATAQKIGALLILLNILHHVVGDFLQIRVYLIKTLAIASMLIGSFGAIRQNNLKRLMAYSTILNVGYVLIAISLNDGQSNVAAICYMLIYIIGISGFFACLLALLGEGADTATFKDIEGAGYSRKAIAGAISIIMFSSIGLPPLAGFFGKYFIFYQAINHGEFALAFLGIITSVVASFYYLKIIKVMYFADKDTEINRILTKPGILIISCLSVAFILCFSLLGTKIFITNL